MRLVQIVNFVILLTKCSAVTVNNTTPSLKKSQPYILGNDTSEEYHGVNDQTLGGLNDDMQVATDTTDTANKFQALVTAEPGASTVKLQAEQLQNRTSNENTNATENNHSRSNIEENIQTLERFNISANITKPEINKNDEIASFENQSFVYNFSHSNYSNNDEHFDEESTGKPQNVLIKIQEDLSLHDPDTKKTELNIEMSTFLLGKNYKKNNGKVQQQETEKDPVADSHTLTSIQEHNKEKRNTSDSLQIHTLTNSTKKINLDNLLLKNGSLPEKELQSDTFITTNLTSTKLTKGENIEVLKTEKHNNDGEKQFIEYNEYEITKIKAATVKNQTKNVEVTNHVNEIKASELIPENNIKQAAQKLPTGTTQLYADQSKVEVTPTISSGMPLIHSKWNALQIHQVPVKMFLTTGIPFYPFQFITFKPSNNIESNTHVYSTSNSDPVVQETPVPAITQRQLTKVKTESLHSQKLTAPGMFHINHHFLPPPWAPHPSRPLNNHHHRRMPIFVLPMSHNVNYAPTFNPDFENHN